MAESASMTETVHEQFTDIEQQRLTGVLGMWVFLATETLMFGGLFVGFAIYRSRTPAVFAEAASHMHIWLGTINTALLLTSGLTMALADRAAEQLEPRAARVLMLITVLLGVTFLGIKGSEWVLEYREGVVPFLGTYTYSGSAPDDAALFFNYYFVMTGLHGLHMLIGIILIAVMIWLLGRTQSAGPASGTTLIDRARQLRIVGMYWAFVDVVWIFVFTALYLLSAAG